MKGRVRIAHSEHLEIRPVDVSSSAINSWYLRRLYVRLEEVSVEGVCKHRARVAPLAEQCSGGGGGVHCFPTLDYGKKDAWPKKMSGEQSAIVDCVPRSIMNPIILSSAPSFIFQWIDSSPVLEG